MIINEVLATNFYTVYINGCTVYNVYVKHRELVIYCTIHKIVIKDNITVDNNEVCVNFVFYFSCIFYCKN